MTDRQRNGLILLIVAGLIAASAVVISVRKTVLGLDLKGGVELVYQATGTPQNPVVSSADLSDAVQDMDNRVDQLGVSEPSISTEGKDLIDVQLPNVGNVGQAEQEVGSTARLAFYDWEKNLLVPGETIKGKTPFVTDQLGIQDPTAQLLSQGSSGGPGGATSSDGALALYDAVKLASEQPAYISKNNARLGPEYFLFGAPNSSACKAAAAAKGTKLQAGDHCLINGPVQTTGGESVQSAVYTGLSTAETKGAQLLKVKQGWLVAQGAPSSFTDWPTYGSDPTAGYYVLRDDAALLGNEVKNPQESTGSDGSPAVSFSFNSQGASAFTSVTAQIASRGQLASSGTTELDEHFAALLDDRILSVPSIDWKTNPDGIDGSQGAEITGNFTVNTADQLATELRLGALPVNLTRISETSVSATLGAQALHQGLIAGLIGLAVVVLFLLLYYRLLGLVAVTGLIVYGVYFFALLKLIPITLTLAGIAGLILTIGVAADANIVIFERVKEEIRAGHSVRQGIAHGYKKGLSAIIDANVVTILTAFILFVLATQDVKGFAFTLGIGTFVSLFTAVMATQAALLTLGSTRSLSLPAMLGAGKSKRRWTADFMGLSRYFFTLSGVILLVGALAIGGRGLNLGIDFTSGTQISVGLERPASVSQVRNVLKTVGGGGTDTTVQAVKGDKALGRNGFQIDTKYLSASEATKLRNELQNDFGIKGGVNGLNTTSVGPTFGSAVADSAVVAIIASLAIISLYVALRFEWKYAVPVLIALAHDLLITAGVYALTGRVVTTDTVAALLTILGYSMYDTIIVFDRVRENTKRMPRAAFSQIVNRSMSEVLTRSLATTACTLMPVIALLIFGGSTLQDFAFALLVGVASGAYSSIFIASPVLTHWKEREHAYVLRRQRIVSELGYVPAYAGDGADVDPSRGAKKPTGSRGLTPLAPDTVSAAEFEQMKRDLALEEEAPPPRTSRLSRRAAGAPAQGGSSQNLSKPSRPSRGPGSGSPASKRAQPGPGQGAPSEESQPRQPAAPKAPSQPVPEDQVFEHAPDELEVEMPNQPKKRPTGGSKNRNRKHGRR